MFISELQLIFKPLLSETNEVNRCGRFPLTPCARTFQNKEYTNTNYLDDSNKRKLSSVFGQYDLTQLIQEPTHFTENSSSLIDLVFTKNTNLVVLSGVGEAFLDQNIRYHCPVYAVFDLEKHKQPCYKRKI